MYAVSVVVGWKNDKSILEERDESVKDERENPQNVIMVIDAIAKSGGEHV